MISINRTNTGTDSNTLTNNKDNYQPENNYDENQIHNYLQVIFIRFTKFKYNLS